MSQLSTFRRAIPVAFVFFALAGKSLAWTPGTSAPAASSGFSVNSWDRTDVLAFYNTAYRASEAAPQRIGWDGNVSSGIAGTTTAAFKEDVRRRVNFYRALAGLPADITIDDLKSAKAQQAALMFSANNAINHFPPIDWTHFSPFGAEAAGASNIALGSFGPDSIDRYMVDDGPNNLIVGHRRWLLFPRAAEMGTGDVPASGGDPAANSTWFIGEFKTSGTTDFVPWPPSGFIPSDLVPTRWSVSRANSDFSVAQVSMTRNGIGIPVSVVARNSSGTGDNSLVWVPQTPLPKGAADITYRVIISGVRSPDGRASYSYATKAFDPSTLGQTVSIGGPSAIRNLRTEFPFTPVRQADGYSLRIEKVAFNAWNEGAEGRPKVRDRTAGAYPLVQQTVKRGGSSAFHLTFPSFEAGEQVFELSREMIPRNDSRLVFHDLFRFSAAGCRLSAEVSEDNGGSWVRVWSRAGNGATTSAGWDTSFRQRSVSLSRFAGKPVRVRFNYSFARSAFIGTDTNQGVFVDDITVTNVGSLSTLRNRWLPRNQKSFRPGDFLRNGSVRTGDQIIMRIRPRVGTVFFPFGPPRAVNVVSIGGSGPEVGVESPPGNGLMSEKSRIRFGAAPIGRNSGFRRLVIRNNGTSPLRLGEITLRGAAFQGLQILGVPQEIVEAGTKRQRAVALPADPDRPT